MGFPFSELTRMRRVPGPCCGVLLAEVRDGLGSLLPELQRIDAVEHVGLQDVRLQLGCSDVGESE